MKCIDCRHCVDTVGSVVCVDTVVGVVCVDTV